MYSHAECMEVVSTKKIRIKPNKTQAKFLRQWIDAARCSYNYTIGKSYEFRDLDEDSILAVQAAGVSADQARPTVISNREPFPSWMDFKKKDNIDFWESREFWLSSIPSKCFTEAFKHACDARKAGFKKGGKFSLKFRKRKDKVQSCFIPKSAVKQNIIFGNSVKKYCGVKEIKFTEQLPENHLDCELVLDHGLWFLSVPYRKTTHPVESQNRVVALDVGVRKFLTFYSEDSCGYLGQGDSNRLFRLAKSLDNIVSKTATSKGKYKKSLWRAGDRIRVKMKNLIKELHYKLANFLVENFDAILLPYYEVSEFVRKGNRKLNNKSVRQMLNFNFYKFSQILDRKMIERKGFLVTPDGNICRRVIRVNEAYTSKTNTISGEIMKNIGSKETIKTKDYTLDRDLNGARNIFLRALVDSPSLQSICEVI